VKHKDWENAERLAEKYAPELVTDIYIGRAKHEFSKREYQKAESYLLRAQKPEIIVKTYRVIW